MRKRYVLTMTAANRVGILAAVTNAMSDLGGDLVEIRQTVLQGFFTMIIAADFPEDRDPDLVLDHVDSTCRRFGVLVTLKDPEAEAVCTTRAEGTENWLLSLEGSDKPGALRTLAKLLAGNGIDVVDLHAARSSAEDEGFRAALQLAVPPTVEIDVFRPQIDALCERIGLVATLSAEPTPSTESTECTDAIESMRPIRLAEVLETAGKPR